jgi:hypothetical protein
MHPRRWFGHRSPGRRRDPTYQDDVLAEVKVFILLYEVGRNGPSQNATA